MHSQHNISMVLVCARLATAHRLPCFLQTKLILDDSFACEEENEDCWRVHAAIARQLPVLLSSDVSDHFSSCLSLASPRFSISSGNLQSALILSE